MKSIVILFETNSEYALKPTFGNLSGKELCEKNINKLGLEVIKIPCCKTVIELLSSIHDECTRTNADYVIFSFDDLPFINEGLVKSMIKSHEEYKAEYTFADGYPYGFSPEIIDCGALKILKELAESTHKDIGEKKVTRNSIYELLKTEINSFEVEAVLSDEDWRLLRLGFHCGTKDNYLSSMALYKSLNNNDSYSVDDIARIASTVPGVLKTVPGFYNIQITNYSFNNSIYSPYNSMFEEKNKSSPIESVDSMPYEKFSYLIDEIASFSNTAVVGLSAWGEAFAHPDIIKMIEKVLSYDGLSVFIETNGLLIDDNICSDLLKIVNNAKARTNGWDKIMISIDLDATSSQKYIEINKNCSSGDFDKAIGAVSKLCKIIPGSVYPQFTRMNENECELESFFRYWNDKDSPSKGKFIIQKYDNFCGILPDRKPADLSPLERNVCWHLRRDMTILCNGDVPLCRSYLFSNCIGNIFNQSLETVWNNLNNTLMEHIYKKYNEKCGKCDEYYTFNF